jgi:hypothetical protein
MAWIVGLANQEEIEKIIKMGYEVREDMDCSQFANTEDTDDKAIAVFVDCDIPDLLVDAVEF